MSKFKVGDRVRIVGNKAGSDNKIGDVGVVSKIGVTDCRVQVDGGPSTSNWSLYDDLVPIPTNTLTPGQTYTSRNGKKWECIFVRDGKAWLVGVYGGKAEGSAYDFDVDGTASWAGDSAYNIVFEPVRTTHYHKVFAHGEERNTKYDVVDGRVDWDSLEILPCE